MTKTEAETRSELIDQHLAQPGWKDGLYRYPLQGIRGVFRPAEINEILALTEQLAA